MAQGDKGINMAQTTKAETPLDPTAPITLTFEQLQTLLARSGARTKEDELELIMAQAKANAEENRKQLKPENATHPGISAFSRPGGELANPKGEFRCGKVVWAGYPLEKETVTADEFDLINQVVPGEYRCTRPDGSAFPVTVTATVDAATGQIERLDVFFATRGQLRHNLPSMVAMCRELIAQAKPSVKVA